ncbi:helix-turn-helix domain-containing protein [Planctomycetota bacterium]
MERIAQAIKNSKHSRYEIWQNTGVDQSVLHRIVNGGRCNIETADRLCKFLGLELVEKKRKKRKKPLLKRTFEKRQGQG